MNLRKSKVFRFSAIGLIFALIATFCFSRNEITGDYLKGLPSLPMSHGKVQVVFNSFKLQKIAVFTSERFKVKSELPSSEQSSFEETTHYVSFDPPIELVVKKMASSPALPSEHVVQKIRIGYPEDGYLFPYLVTNSRHLKQPDIEKYKQEQFGKGGQYFPYGIGIAMTKDQILKKFSRPYFSQSVIISKDGTGYIDFSIDGPTPPFPIVVWFHENHVCGVDLK